MSRYLFLNLLTLRLFTVFVTKVLQVLVQSCVGRWRSVPPSSQQPHFIRSFVLVLLYEILYSEFHPQYTTNLYVVVWRLYVLYMYTLHITFPRVLLPSSFFPLGTSPIYEIYVLNKLRVLLGSIIVRVKCLPWLVVSPIHWKGSSVRSFMIGTRGLKDGHEWPSFGESTWDLSFTVLYPWKVMFHILYQTDSGVALE